MSSSPPQPAFGKKPDPEDLEARRRLTVLQNNQRGRQSTILTSGKSSNPVASQTLLGAG